MEFFSLIYEALSECEIDKKEKTFRRAYESFHRGTSHLDHDLDIRPLSAPSFSDRLNVVHPTKIRRPKYTNSCVALARILHSIAHIEYNAIDIGLDALYRFRNLDEEFYLDFLELSLQEISHFRLIDGIMRKIGFKYGDFQVHDNLFEAMIKTQNLTDRMALLHKGMEGMGLDANPFVCEKIKRSSSPHKEEILDALGIILRDEIVHVSMGIKWLNYAQKLSNDSRSYADIVGRFSGFSIIGIEPNMKARIQAGFSTEEIETIAKQRRARPEGRAAGQHRESGHDRLSPSCTQTT